MKQLRVKLSRQGGLTLIEMLLVVAIISILVAISIPVVNMNLEKAREATDKANERAAKTLATLLYMGELEYNTIPGGDPMTTPDYLPGQELPVGWNEFGQPTGIYYDAESGTLSWNKPANGYGQSTGNKDCVIVISISAEGVFTPNWRVLADGG